MKKYLSRKDKLLSEYKEIASFMNYFKVEPEEATKEIKAGWYKNNPFLENKVLIGYPPRHPDYIGESLLKVEIKWRFLLERFFQSVRKNNENNFILTSDDRFTISYDKNDGFSVCSRTSNLNNKHYKNYVKSKLLKRNLNEKQVLDLLKEIY